jgi:hypothetical protein
MGKARVMIVEDEAIVAADLQATLRRLGYEVSAIAFSVEEAMRWIEEVQMDLVVMNIDNLVKSRIRLICHFGPFASVIPSEARNLNITLRAGSGRNLMVSACYIVKISRFARNDMLLRLFTRPSIFNLQFIKVVPAVRGPGSGPLPLG